MPARGFEAAYTRLKVIGKGSFGEAVLVRSKADGQRYVAKEIDLSSLTAKEKEEAKNEILVLQQVDHPNIIKLHEYFQSSSTLSIVMEFADGGDIDARIRRQRTAGSRFTEAQVMNWFIQIVLALKHLHDKRILHRDLKGQNVFLTATGIVKLGDFGISTVLRNTMAKANTVCGTPYYFSPEICNNQPYNNKSDVWALGCILYELCALQTPFQGRTMFELMKSICTGRFTMAPVESNYSRELVALILRLLHSNAALRLSVDSILRVHYVQDALKRFSQEFRPTDVVVQRAVATAGALTGRDKGESGSSAEDTSAVLPPASRERGGARREKKQGAPSRHGARPSVSPPLAAPLPDAARVDQLPRRFPEAGSNVNLPKLGREGGGVGNVNSNAIGCAMGLPQHPPPPGITPTEIMQQIRKEAKEDPRKEKEKLRARDWHGIEDKQRRIKAELEEARRAHGAGDGAGAGAGRARGGAGREGSPIVDRPVSRPPIRVDPLPAPMLSGLALAKEDVLDSLLNVLQAPIGLSNLHVPPLVVASAPTTEGLDRGGCEGEDLLGTDEDYLRASLLVAEKEAASMKGQIQTLLATAQGAPEADNAVWGDSEPFTASFTLDE